MTNQDNFFGICDFSCDWDLKDSHIAHL